MAKLYKVMATELNFRVAADKDAEIITVLPRNQVVEIVKSDAATGWSQIRTQVLLVDEEGFVATRFLVPLNEKPAPEDTDLTVSASKLKRLSPSARDSIINPLDTTSDDILTEYSINQNSRRITHFFAQVAHECGGFRILEENLNYSAERLQVVWPPRFPTDAIAEQYGRNPEKIANKVYASRIGNGPESSGDGWRFRGRGLIQLTGRANYEKFGPLAGVDIIADPDLAQEPVTALRLAAAFWDSKNLNTLADQNQFKLITRRINGGENGLEDRRTNLNRARTIWG